MAEFSLIKIDGELTKPATLLVEKVAGALGVLYEPTRIKRKAKAESDAEKIKTIANLEIDDLERRALSRLVKQEARKQKNIEEITAAAIESLPEDAKVADLEEDWIAYFFKQCEHISDNEMQTVWAKLLSGEATNPGTYSKRTIDFISTIDKKDAELFTKLCTFAWWFGEANPVIFEIKNEVYEKAQINFPALTHLDALGLISFQSFTGFVREFDSVNETIISYYDRPLKIEFQSAENSRLKIGTVVLTNVGKELSHICGATPSQEFYEYSVKKFSEQGLVLSSIVGERSF